MKIIPTLRNLPSSFNGESLLQYVTFFCIPYECDMLLTPWISASLRIRSHAISDGWVPELANVFEVPEPINRANIKTSPHISYRSTNLSQIYAPSSYFSTSVRLFGRLLTVSVPPFSCLLPFSLLLSSTLLFASPSCTFVIRSLSILKAYPFEKLRMLQVLYPINWELWLIPYTSASWMIFH